MPKPTFFNLPPEKQQTILEIAIEEFAGHDYGVASISQVVKQAKISKGSFYQYFEDKKDLYLHLVDLAVEREIEFLLASTPPESQTNVFAHLRWIFYRSADLVMDDPRWCRIMYRALYGDVPFRDEVYQRAQLALRHHLQKIVEQGIERGEITSEIDVDLAVFAIDTLWDSSGYWIPQKLGIDVKKLDREQITEEKLKFAQKWFDSIIYILEHGLSAKATQKNLPKS
ncbi:MAG: TetR/AcrR family transcriptional regulator [Cyanobacteria bacterium SID2]|nr:TetR/AcrR family transcriptional regulator [Cyanobacteria bacterium SID2]MBP0004033.1 TetR/AcrR family transcriptional regulator [Cyanobacteria bacterium SBC]